MATDGSEEQMALLEFEIEWIEDVPVSMVSETEGRHPGTVKVIVPTGRGRPEHIASDILHSLRTIANLIEAEPRILESPEYYEDFMLVGIDLAPGRSVIPIRKTKRPPR